MNSDTIIIRLLQAGLIAFALMSFTRNADTASQAMDFALNRPATIGDQQRTILQELPAYFQASDPNTVVQQALENGDIALARIYIDYASTLRRTPLSQETLDQFEDATGWWATAKRSVSDCTIGAVFRESDNMTAIGCQLATDLFVVGDVADIVNEGADWYYGREYDEIILGLSIIGAGSSALSLAYPGAAPAAGGVAAAKVVVRPATKGFKISGPLRLAVKRAIDFEALELARKNATSWRHAKGYLSNPKQFLRPKETAILMDGLGNIAAIGKRTDAATATRVLRRAESLEDVSGAAKIMDVAGGHSKAVLNIMGVKAIKFAKVAKPVISASKLTYKASVIGSGFLAGLAALAIEFLLRKNLRQALFNRRAKAAAAQKGAAKAWGLAMGSALVVSLVIGVLLYQMQTDHDASMEMRAYRHNAQAASDINQVYLEDIEQRAGESEQIAQWMREHRFERSCASGGMHDDPYICRRAIAAFHESWGL